MLLSSIILKNSYENYERNHEHFNENDDIQENYRKKNTKIDLYYLMFYISIIFFILEIILFSYAMIITIKCSKNKHEFIINTILSTIFTTPFIFFSMLSNECAKTTIQNL